jgi:hypothetical protein
MSTESGIGAVPKKYWIAGGAGALLLLLIFARRRRAAPADTGAADGLVSALQLPGGLQYAPVTSGVSGGTGANQDSGLPQVAPATLMLGDVTSNQAPQPLTAATIPGSSPPPAPAPAPRTTASTRPAPSPFPSPSNPGVAPSPPASDNSSGIIKPDGTEIPRDEVLNFFKSHPVNTPEDLTHLYSFGQSLGLSNLGISQARYIALRDLGMDTYNLGQGSWGTDPNGTKWDAAVKAAGPGQYAS